MKYPASFLVILLFLLFSQTEVFAHLLKSDNKVGAVIHIDPGDNIIAGQESIIFLELKDKDNLFNLFRCECRLSVFRDNEEIFNQNLKPVSENDLLSSVTYFTFPEKGSYYLKINGVPKSDYKFEAFELNYEVFITREKPKVNIQKKSNSWFSTHLVHLTGGFFIIGFFIFALIKQSVEKKGE